MTFNVALIGYGSIGFTVGQALLQGAVQGAALIGAVVRTPGRAQSHGIPELTIDQAVQEADLIVECAGPGAVREYGAQVIDSGADLLIVSVGALAEPELREELVNAGPGRLFITNGAIGGLDLLGAVTELGQVDNLRLTTSKLPQTLIQPWMRPEQEAKILAARQPLTLYEGGVHEAIEKFPNSLNVAIALAHTTNTWEQMQVQLIADPQAHHVQHQIDAESSGGSYQFSITNKPSEVTATTSGVVAGSLLRGIRVWAGQSGIAL